MNRFIKRGLILLPLLAIATSNIFAAKKTEVVLNKEKGKIETLKTKFKQLELIKDEMKKPTSATEVKIDSNADGVKNLCGDAIDALEKSIKDLVGGDHYSDPSANPKPDVDSLLDKLLKADKDNIDTQKVAITTKLEEIKTKADEVRYYGTWDPYLWVLAYEKKVDVAIKAFAPPQLPSFDTAKAAFGTAWAPFYMALDELKTATKEQSTKKTELETKALALAASVTGLKATLDGLKTKLGEMKTEVGKDVDDASWDTIKERANAIKTDIEKVTFDPGAAAATELETAATQQKTALETVTAKTGAFGTAKAVFKDVEFAIAEREEQFSLKTKDEIVATGIRSEINNAKAITKEKDKDQLARTLVVAISKFGGVIPVGLAAKDSWKNIKKASDILDVSFETLKKLAIELDKFADAIEGVGVVLGTYDLDPKNLITVAHADFDLDQSLNLGTQWLAAYTKADIDLSEAKRYLNDLLKNTYFANAYLAQAVNQILDNATNADSLKAFMDRNKDKIPTPGNILKKIDPTTWLVVADGYKTGGDEQDAGFEAKQKIDEISGKDAAEQRTELMIFFSNDVVGGGFKEVFATKAADLTKIITTLNPTVTEEADALKTTFVSGKLKAVDLPTKKKAAPSVSITFKVDRKDVTRDFKLKEGVSAPESDDYSGITILTSKKLSTKRRSFSGLLEDYFDIEIVDVGKMSNDEINDAVGKIKGEFPPA